MAETCPRLVPVSITSTTDAQRILISQEYSSARVHTSFAPWEAYGPAHLERIRAFFGQWLMYREGDAHRTQRKRAAKALSQVTSQQAFRNLPCHLLIDGDGRMHTETVATFCRYAHRQLWGLSEQQHRDMLAKSRAILAFLGDQHPTQSKLEQTVHAIADLETWFQTEVFAAEAWPSIAREAGVDDAVSLNMMVDSYDPVEAAMSSFLFTWAQSEVDRKAMSFSGLVDAALRTSPPFRYINRICVKDASTIEKHSIDLLACAAEDTGATPSLHFGFGRHLCVGAAAAKSILQSVHNYLVAPVNRLTVSDVRGERVARDGLCFVDEIAIATTPTRTHCARMLEDTRELQRTADGALVLVPAPPVPALGRTDARVEVIEVGVCGSDIGAYRDLPGRLRTWGHEILCRVQHVGQDVSGVAAGDYAVVRTTAPCGRCEKCLAHQPEACPNFKRHAFNGFTSALVLPARLLLRVPNSSAAPFVLTEPLNVAIDLLRDAWDVPAERVLFVGTGTLALMAMTVLRQAGRTGVTAVTRRADTAKSKHARALGAKLFEGFATLPQAHFDLAIVTAPYALIPAVVPHMRYGGLVTYNGISPQKEVCLNLFDLHMRKLTLKPSFPHPQGDFAQAIRLLERHADDFRPLLSHQVPLTDAAQRLPQLISDPAAIKIVLQTGSPRPPNDTQS